MENNELYDACKVMLGAVASVLDDVSPLHACILAHGAAKLTVILEEQTGEQYKTRDLMMLAVEDMLETMPEKYRNFYYDMKAAYGNFEADEKSPYNDL